MLVADATVGHDGYGGTAASSKGRTWCVCGMGRRRGTRADGESHGVRRKGHRPWLSCHVVDRISDVQSQTRL